MPTHNTRENFVRDLSESVRYFANVNQYPIDSDEQKAYLEGVQTAIAMMYIDLTGTPKSEGMLAKFLHQELQKAREEALAREKQLKQVHMMELDAISCKSIEDFVIWRDHRKQRPNQSELDQP